MEGSNGREARRNTGNHHNSRKKRRTRHNEFHSQGSETIRNDPTPPIYVLRPNLVDVFPPEDERLLSEFSACHAGFLLSKETHPLDIRRSAYENFASFLKFLRSHSTLDLMTTMKPTVSAQLDVLRLYGFKGEWFDDLVSRLNHHPPGIADEDLQKLTELEAVYSRHIGGLEEEYEVLSRRLDELKGKLFAGKETVEDLSTRKKQIMEVRASLDVPFTF